MEFLIFILIMILISILYQQSTEGALSNNFNFQIIFAILTGIITTIIIHIYGIARNYLSLRLYIGHWAVVKFESENYNALKAFVIIGSDTEETLTYSYTDLENLNNIKGTIYINKNNRKTGKLISCFKYANQVETDYPISERSIYFDESTYESKKQDILIRVMDLNGLEKITLIKPEDQEKFKKKVNIIYNETISNLAIPFQLDKNQ